MKTFDLELRVQTSGSVLAWVVYLENVGSNSKVRNWLSNTQDEYLVKKLPDFSINDNALDVYMACEGKPGAKVSCTVLINGEVQKVKTVSNTNDKDYAHGVYKIQ